MKPRQIRPVFQFNFELFQALKSRMLDEDHGCGYCKTDISLGETGNVSSPGYPGPYEDDLHCLWLLQTKDNSRIRLTCTAVHLQSCGTLGMKLILFCNLLFACTIRVVPVL